MSYKEVQPNILIVDDEPNNLKVLHNLLTQNGYDVRAARDGQTALSAVTALPPDLILLDIKMPKMGGYEVCERLKVDKTTRDIPVIFISALNHVDDIVTAFKVGGVDYVTKPFQFEEVLARVRTHLTIVEQQRQLIMQREQIEAMRARDKERFQQISKMQEQFVQAAAHDLKNPLALITGYAGIMRRFDEVRTSPQLMECVEAVEISGNEMLELVKSMLEFIRMQASVTLNLQPVDLASFLHEHLHMYTMQAAQRNIKIHYIPPKDTMTVHVDPSLMQRVIDNLLSNAIKYSEDGGSVEVIISPDGDKVALHVTDKGCGIDEQDIPYLFDPFYRARQPRDGIEGTGLGLSIVKEIVEQHLGQIRVNSKVNEGSTFSVYLPLRNAT